MASKGERYEDWYVINFRIRTSAEEDTSGGEGFEKQADASEKAKESVDELNQKVQEQEEYIKNLHKLLDLSSQKLIKVSFSMWALSVAIIQTVDAFRIYSDTTETARRGTALIAQSVSTLTYGFFGLIQLTQIAGRELLMAFAKMRTIPTQTLKQWVDMLPAISFGVAGVIAIITGLLPVILTWGREMRKALTQTIQGFRSARDEISNFFKTQDWLEKLQIFTNIASKYGKEVANALWSAQSPGEVWGVFIQSQEKEFAKLIKYFKDYSPIFKKIAEEQGYVYGAYFAKQAQNAMTQNIPLMTIPQGVDYRSQYQSLVQTYDITKKIADETNNIEGKGFDKLNQKIQETTKSSRSLYSIIVEMMNALDTTPPLPFEYVAYMRGSALEKQLEPIEKFYINLYKLQNKSWESFKLQLDAEVRELKKLGIPEVDIEAYKVAKIKEYEEEQLRNKQKFYAELERLRGNDFKSFQITLQAEINELKKLGIAESEINEYITLKTQEWLRERWREQQSFYIELYKLRKEDRKAFELELEIQADKFREIGIKEADIAEWKALKIKQYEEEITEKQKQELERRESAINQFYIKLYRLLGETYKALELEVAEELKTLRDLNIPEADIKLYQQLRLLEPLKNALDEYNNALKRLIYTTQELEWIDFVEQLQKWRDAGIDISKLVYITELKVQQYAKDTTSTILQEIERRINEIRRQADEEIQQARRVAEAYKNYWVRGFQSGLRDYDRELFDIAYQFWQVWTETGDEVFARWFAGTQIGAFIERWNKQEDEKRQRSIESMVQANQEVWRRINELTMSSFQYRIWLLEQEANEFVKRGANIVDVQRWVSEEIKRIKQEETQKWIDEEMRKLRTAQDTQKSVWDYLVERKRIRPERYEQEILSEVEATMRLIDQVLADESMTLEQRFAVIEQLILPNLTLRHRGILSPEAEKRFKEYVMTEWQKRKQIYTQTPKFEGEVKITEKPPEVYQPKYFSYEEAWKKVEEFFNILKKKFTEFDNELTEKIKAINEKFLQTIFNDETIQALLKKFTDFTIFVVDKIDWLGCGKNIGQLIVKGITEGLQDLFKQFGIPPEKIPEFFNIIFPKQQQETSKPTGAVRSQVGVGMVAGTSQDERQKSIADKFIIVDIINELVEKLQFSYQSMISYYQEIIGQIDGAQKSVKENITSLTSQLTNIINDIIEILKNLANPLNNYTQLASDYIKKLYDETQKITTILHYISTSGASMGAPANAQDKENQSNLPPSYQKMQEKTKASSNLNFPLSQEVQRLMQLEALKPELYTLAMGSIYKKPTWEEMGWVVEGATYMAEPYTYNQALEAYRFFFGQGKTMTYSQYSQQYQQTKTSSQPQQISLTIQIGDKVIADLVTDVVTQKISVGI